MWCRDCAQEVPSPQLARHRGHELTALTGARGGSGDLGAGVVRLGTGTSRALERLPSGMDAFDRLVGDARQRGMVHNGLYLIAGPPGIGKTTLTTQVAAGLAQRGEVVLLATGEEARDQVDDRARRLGVDGVPGLYLVETRRWGDVEDAIRTHAGSDADPSVVIVDSAQRYTVLAHGGEAGSNMQIEALAHRAQDLAKRSGRCVVLIAQINADGDVRGPKALEHAVDCVLLYEKNTDAQRMLRVTKNRFGAADNAVMLEMTERGLRELRGAIPAALTGTPEPGVVAFPAILGAQSTTAVLVAVEASVDEVTDDMPKVVDAQGYPAKDLRRVLDTLARNTAFPLAARSVRVSVPMLAERPIADPALDLAVAAAVLSAAAGKVAPAAFGRIALSGRVEPDAKVAARVRALVEPGRGAPVGPMGARGVRGIAHVRELLDAIAPGVFSRDA
jgi:DNA repair protein RadA/Sms